VLYSFRNKKDGANPNGGLVFDKKGALFGTAYFGGRVDGHCRGAGGIGCGTVFKLNPPATKSGKWTLQLLHVFLGDSDDGSNPAAGVTLDKQGNLFGTTFFGPQNGWGTVFELKKPSTKSHAWTERVLYRFTNGTDDTAPMGGLLFDSEGSFYGSAGFGGRTSGNVFKLKPPIGGKGDWTFHVVYGFKGPPDAAIPSGNLMFDHQGGIYGTTEKGGTGTGQACQFGCGTVFQVTP
jgi:hypothetical protein